MIVLAKNNVPCPFAVRTVGSQMRLVKDCILTNRKSLDGFLMSPKALRRRGGVPALADTIHAVAVPLPYRGTASVTRELESRGEP